jgi:hypothetical protein
MDRAELLSRGRSIVNDVIDRGLDQHKMEALLLDLAGAWGVEVEEPLPARIYLDGEKIVRSDTGMRHAKAGKDIGEAHFILVGDKRVGRAAVEAYNRERANAPKVEPAEPRFEVSLTPRWEWPRWRVKTVHSPSRLHIWAPTFCDIVGYAMHRLAGELIVKIEQTNPGAAEG